MKKIELFYFFNFDYNQIKKIKIKKGGLKLRAAILEENNVVKIQEIEMPEIKDEDVLVQVKYSGVCGSDIPRLFNNGARFYPIILGHEFSGIVTKVGSKVENIVVGDKVAVAPLEPCMKCSDCIKGHFSQCKHYSFIGSRKQGAWAEYVAVPAKNAGIKDIIEVASLDQGGSPITYLVTAAFNNKMISEGAIGFGVILVVYIIGLAATRNRYIKLKNANS